MDTIKIPQNIQIADKLLGPFSMMQLLMVGLGGGISYMLFIATQKALGTIPPVAHAFIWLPLGFTAAFAMIRINDIPLTRYVLLIFELIIKPKQRCFTTRKGVYVNFTVSEKDKKHSEKAKITKDTGKIMSGSRLEDLSVILDREGLSSQNVVPGRKPAAQHIDTITGADWQEYGGNAHVEESEAEKALFEKEEKEKVMQRKRIDAMAQKMTVMVQPLTTSIDNLHHTKP